MSKVCESCITENQVDYYIRESAIKDFTYSQDFVYSIVTSAYYEIKKRGYRAEYLACYRDLIENLYHKEVKILSDSELITNIDNKIDKLRGETREDFRSINEKLDKIDGKLDKLSEKTSYIDTRVAVIEAKNESIWKSKELWVPVACAIIVAIISKLL